MRNKRAEGYIGTSIMIFIFCIAIALFISFVTTVNIIHISKQNTIKVIDSYVTLKSIEEYESLRVGEDYTEQLDNEAFKEQFRKYNNLTQNDDMLIANNEAGKEIYRISDLELSFIEEKTLKLQAHYVITVPVTFGEFNIFEANVPITIKSKYVNKFS